MDRYKVVFATLIIATLVLSVIGILYYTPDNPDDGSVYIDQYILTRELETGLTFSTNIIPLGENYLVTQKNGSIWWVSNSVKEVFMEIPRDDIEYKESEEGLLGIALSPDFETTGIFYLDFTDDSKSYISRFKTTGDGKGNYSSRVDILVVNQAFPNHNGGQLAFGPDGYLYIALGDEGSAEDPLNNGQDLTTLHGSILRIDPTENGYNIPPDNPFVGNTDGYREEIWAYGFRNPWRFSFDPETGDLWSADVGQVTYEEVNLVKKGENYGWNRMEGPKCRGIGTDCSKFTPPIAYYGHDLGSAIIGGYVYRGTELPDLNGMYIFGDFQTGRVWGTDKEGNMELLLKEHMTLLSFGVTVGSELLLLTYNGTVFKLTST